MSIMVTFSTLCLWISSTENVFRDSKITLSGISSDTLPTKVVIVASLTNFLLCSSTYRAFIDVRIPSSNSKVLFLSRVSSNFSFLHASTINFFLALEKVVASLLLMGDKACLGWV